MTAREYKRRVCRLLPWRILGVIAIALVLSRHEVASGQVVECEPTVWSLVAGQKMTAGTVAISNDEQNFYVTYTIDRAAYPKGTLGQLHVWIGNDISKLPSLAPGAFAKAPGGAAASASGLAEYTLTVPFANSDCGSGAEACGKSFAFVAHAEVFLNGDSTGAGSETAFGGDMIGGGDRWWRFGEYMGCCSNNPVPTGTTTIDEFGGSCSVVANVIAPIQSSAITSKEAIGGIRRFSAIHLAGPNGFSTQMVSGALIAKGDPLTLGKTKVIWDRNPTSKCPNRAGLDGIVLRKSPSDGILFWARSSSAESRIWFTVYGDGGQCAIGAAVVPASNSPRLVSIPFSHMRGEGDKAIASDSNIFKRVEALVMEAAPSVSNSHLIIDKVQVGCAGIKRVDGKDVPDCTAMLAPPVPLLGMTCRAEDNPLKLCGVTKDASCGGLMPTPTAPGADPTKTAPPKVTAAPNSTPPTTDKTPAPSPSPSGSEPTRIPSPSASPPISSSPPVVSTTPASDVTSGAPGATGTGVAIPTITPNTQACSVDEGKRDLRVQLGSGVAGVTNTSHSCSYQVSLISYRVLGDIEKTPEIFDTDPDKLSSVLVPPGQSVNLKVALPECASQVDLIAGNPDPIRVGLVGYGERLLASEVFPGTGVCQPHPQPTISVCQRVKVPTVAVVASRLARKGITLIYARAKKDVARTKGSKKCTVNLGSDLGKAALLKQQALTLIRDELQTDIEVCGNDCIEVSLTNIKGKLTKLARSLGKVQSKMARKALSCRVPGIGGGTGVSDSQGTLATAVSQISRIKSSCTVCP